MEKDSLGEVSVPSQALFGIQTQRAIENFPVSGQRFPRAFLVALAHLKGACARANRELRPDRMPEEISRLIQESSAEVAQGGHDAHFPVDLFQTGSGTSTHMNMNEVIANLSNRKAGGTPGIYIPVHPNDHVNMSQSSNDVIPTSIHLAALAILDGELKPALDQLAGALETKAGEFDSIVKLGRTHLMDATPVRLGQEFGGFAAQIRKSWAQIDRESRGLEEVALGGTAVGTGINCPAGFAMKVCETLGGNLGRPIREAPNHFEAQSGRDDLVRVSGALKALACALMKVANDIRLMGSGPFGGLGELLLPELQPGSSIMPGKVNPVICEMAAQVAAQVMGNDLAITVGGQGGHLELNAMMPLMAANLLSSISILANASRLFASRCVEGIRVDEARCREMLDQSPILATVLVPRIGYERTALLVQAALRGRKSIRTMAAEQGILTTEEAERLFDYRRLTEPGDSDPPAGQGQPRRP